MKQVIVNKLLEDSASINKSAIYKPLLLIPDNSNGYWELINIIFNGTDRNYLYKRDMIKINQ